MNKNKSIYQLRKERESNCTFDDFPVGRKVQVVTPAEDCYFFYNETGIVIGNTGNYLGIKVKFDVPRKFEDNYIQYDFNFNPKSLIPLEDVPIEELAKQWRERMYLYYEVNSSELTGMTGNQVANFKLFKDSKSAEKFKSSVKEQYAKEGYSISEDYSGEEDAFIMENNLDEDLYFEIHIKEIELHKDSK